MARRTPVKESVPVTLSTQRAIDLLRTQLAAIDDILRLRHDDPSIKKWEMTTTNILNGIFGMPNGDMHDNTRQFAYASGGSLHMNMTASGVTQNRPVGDTSKPAS